MFSTSCFIRLLYFEAFFDDRLLQCFYISGTGDGNQLFLQICFCSGNTGNSNGNSSNSNGSSSNGNHSGATGDANGNGSLLDDAGNAVEDGLNGVENAIDDMTGDMARHRAGGTMSR